MLASCDLLLPPGARRTPVHLQENVSEWWLLLEALWPPFKMAASCAVGIALFIKLLTTGCLACLERQSRKEKARREEEKARREDERVASVIKEEDDGDSGGGETKTRETKKKD